MTHDPTPDATAFMGWVPAEHLDEIAPDCRATPDAWLVRDGGERFLDGAEPGQPTRPLSDGDFVLFSGLTDYPRVRVAWGGAEVDDFVFLTAVPRGATCFSYSDAGNAPDLEDLMTMLVATDAIEPGATIEVDCYDWRDTMFVLRDGGFHEVKEPAHA